MLFLCLSLKSLKHEIKFAQNAGKEKYIFFVYPVFTSVFTGLFWRSTCDITTRPNGSTRFAMKSASTAPTHWRHASTVLPPVKKSSRLDSTKLPAAGKTDSTGSLHLSSETNVSLSSQTVCRDSYVRHDVTRRKKLERPNFDSSKVSGLGYSVLGLSETSQWTSVKQSSYDGIAVAESTQATIKRNRPQQQAVARNTPTSWTTDNRSNYGSKANEILDQCKLRRRELANQAAMKKDTLSRIQFA